MSKIGKKTRRWIIVLAAIGLLALLAEVGHTRLGWWRSSPATVRETPRGYRSTCEPVTLEEALNTAHQALDEIGRDVHDYSAVIIKRQGAGKETTATVMFAKIREKPFAVYLYFFIRRNDAGVKGREVIYARGLNHDRLLVHTPGAILDGTLSLDPKGWLAMIGERHPITDIGLANLCRQLIQRGEAAGDPRQVQVVRRRPARINTRSCTLLEITYPVHEPQTRAYLARVFLDDEWQFPIRVEIYRLPVDRKQGPQLEEEYTYLDVKLNPGYSDADFDPKNPQYSFPK